jgi:hypothetical protein
MKHLIPLVYIFAALCGCATKPAIAEYEELFLKDAVQIMSWPDSAQSLTESIHRTYTVASAFLEAYPDEKDVGDIVLTVMQFSSDILHGINNINSAINFYCQEHSAYMENKTVEQSKILYQHLSDILLDIQQLYVQLRLREPMFNVLKNTMMRHIFSYSTP